MKRKSALLALRHRACKSWGMTVLETDIKFLGKGHFAIKSPLTNKWIQFLISEHALRAKVPPEAIHPIFKYYCEMRWLLLNARAFRPMNGDITAFDAEEAFMFGVKSWR